MLGAKDVAFPRLNLASFYLWWGGAVFFLLVLLAGLMVPTIGTLDTGLDLLLPLCRHHANPASSWR